MNLRQHESRRRRPWLISDVRQMVYSTEVLSDFMVTAHLGSGVVTHPEAEAGMRSAFSTRAQILDTIREITGTMFHLWTREQRVMVARALAAKGLPSLLDMMIYLDGREEKLLKAKRLKDDFEYGIAMDLLKEDALTVRQRLRMNRLVLAFEAQKLKSSRLRT